MSTKKPSAKPHYGLPDDPTLSSPEYERQDVFAEPAEATLLNTHEVDPSADELGGPEFREAWQRARRLRAKERRLREEAGPITGELATVPAAQDSAAATAAGTWGTGKKKKKKNRYSFGVVVLTQGKRPEDLQRGIASLFRQKGVDLDVVCVCNGGTLPSLPGRVKRLMLPENVGIPAGRNEGVPFVDGEFLFFLDDDAWLPDETSLLKMAQLMRTKPNIGLIQPQVADPENPESPKRWIPRLRKRSAAHSSNVFSVWEGAVCLQRRAFDKAGGWPAPFWYAHEGIELAWRIWDAGYQVWYMGDLTVAHPVMDPKRHEEYFFMNARNRVWLARRNLPFPLNLAYVSSWTLVQMMRWANKPDQLKPWFEGWRAGWRTDPWGSEGPKKKLSGRTLLAMSAHGRPPVI